MSIEPGRSLYGVKLSGKDDLSQFVTELQKVVEEVYPGNWDITINSSSHNSIRDCTIRLIIKIGDVTIRNSRGSMHRIRDLYVKIIFAVDANEGIKMLYGLSGFRATITNEEYAAGYIHSHIRRGRYLMHQFCLGNNSSSMGVLMKAATQYHFNYPKGWKDKKRKEQWFGYVTSVLLELKSFVEWESLEGVPYISMTSVPSSRYKFQSTSPQSIRCHAENEFSRYILPNIGKLIKSKEIAVFLDNQAMHPVTIKFSEVFEKRLDKVIPLKSVTLENGTVQDIIINPQAGQEYYKIRMSNSIHFQGKIVTLFRRPYNFEGMETTTQIQGSQKVKDALKTMIEKHIYSKYLTYVLQQERRKASSRNAEEQRQADSFRKTIASNLTVINET